MVTRVLCTTLFVVGLCSWRLNWSAIVAVFAGLGLMALWLPKFWGKEGVGLVLAFSLAVGLGRAALDDRFQPSSLAAESGAKGAYRGTVLEAPRQWGSSLVFFFTITECNGEALKNSVLVLARWSGSEDIVAPGERWEFSGRLGEGEPEAYPGGFSQKFWLWTQGAQGVLNIDRFSAVTYLGPPRGWGPRALAARLRLSMLDRLAGIEDPLARALVVGVVFGDTQALPKDVQQHFRRTGTSHLLAASGMNVALLVGLVTAAARLLGFGAWRVAPLLIPVAIGYAFLAGCAPSITRAAAAAVMGLLAAWWGRSSGPWNSLCLSVWTLLLWEPRQIYDPGFQLSVAAVIGLIAGPSLDDSAAGWKKSGLMTLSACLLTMPIMVTMFHELSLTLLPANLVLGPLVELLFPAGLLLSMFPFKPLLWATEQLAQLCLWLVKQLSAWADPVPLADPEPASLVLLFVAMALWIGTERSLRWWALLVAPLAVLWGQTLGCRPLAEPGELVVRQVLGSGKPYYWLSSHSQELLVLTEAWQEKRAISMLLDQGCRRRPQVKVLPVGKTFTVHWGAFHWGEIAPLLPKAPFVEVRTTGCSYDVQAWRP